MTTASTLANTSLISPRATARPWVMTQSWHDLLFMHWPVSIDSLRRRIPAGLEIDTYENTAWLGLVAFWMDRVRLRRMPMLSVFPAFAELNVRTYVRHQDRPGVFFLSLDAPDWLAIFAARRWYRLAYVHSRMSARWIDGWLYYELDRADRRAPDAHFRARYRPAGEAFHAEPGSLDHWLTERYCLYVESGRGLWRADIVHPPWPLQTAAAHIDVNSMAGSHSISLPDGPPLLHFARRMDTRVWAPRRI